MTKAERTKQTIIEKTAPVFNTKGYAGTSITDITEATGLTKGSVYGNFSNKDEVALAAFDHNLKTVQNIIKQGISQRTAVREKLLAYVDIYENYLNYPFPVGGCPILNTAIEADDTHTTLKKKVSDAIVAWKDSIVALIQMGIEQKEFREAIDAEQFALSVIALIEGSVMISRATGKTHYRKAIMQTVKNMVMALN